MKKIFFILMAISFCSCISKKKFSETVQQYEEKVTSLETKISTTTAKTVIIEKPSPVVIERPSEKQGVVIDSTLYAQLDSAMFVLEGTRSRLQLWKDRYGRVQADCEAKKEVIVEPCPDDHLIEVSITTVDSLVSVVDSMKKRLQIKTSEEKITKVGGISLIWAAIPWIVLILLVTWLVKKKIRIF